VTQTHATAAIVAATQDSRFVAVNGALEVDLFGQVNAERSGGTIQAGAGGLPAFAQAARVAPAARLLICLASTSKQGTVSRIVPALGDASLCTLPRHLADAVVTEHGVAELRGLGLDARAEALIAVAAPEHRDALAAAWQRMRAQL
jgi:acyl-CoA hydrolase